MKSCDLSSASAKLELALKSLRTTLNVVDEQWKDQARKKFQDAHMANVEPSVRNMLDAIGRLAEVIAAAEHHCGSE
jgi:hypothetical protein